MIYKRGNRYWVLYWRDGKRFRESVQKAKAVFRAVDLAARQEGWE